MEEEPMEDMIVYLSNDLQVYIKLNAQYVTWYFVIPMKLHVVPTASATHAVNKSKGKTVLAHGVEMKNFRSMKTRAWDASSTNLKFTAHTV